MSIHVGLSLAGQSLANRRQMLPVRVVWVSRDENRPEVIETGVEFMASIAAQRERGLTRKAKHNSRLVAPACADGHKPTSLRSARDRRLVLFLRRMRLGRKAGPHHFIIDLSLAGFTLFNQINVATDGVVSRQVLAKLVWRSRVCRPTDGVEE